MIFPNSLPLGPINLPTLFYTCHISYILCQKSPEAKHMVIWETTLKIWGIRAEEYQFSLHRTLLSYQVYISSCSLPKPIFPKLVPPCHVQPPGMYTHHPSSTAFLLDYWDATFSLPHHIHNTTFQQLTKEKEKEDHRIFLEWRCKSTNPSRLPSMLGKKRKHMYTHTRSHMSFILL